LQLGDITMTSNNHPESKNSEPKVSTSNSIPPDVTIYTDGAAEPNPGPGGYGVVLLHGNHRKEMSGMFRLTTNNRMEILAAIVGLEALKEPCNVTLYSDSKYLVDAMSLGWVKQWKAKRWRRGKKAKVINKDLWERLLSLCDKHQVEFKWVKGHAGIPENERCDRISMQFLGKQNLLEDKGYAASVKEQTFWQDIESEANLSAPVLGNNRDSLKRAPTLPSKIVKKAKSEKEKMTHEGQPCRKCSIPVIKRITRQKPKGNRNYYFEYYFYCPNCRTMYMVEDAKRHFK